MEWLASLADCFIVVGFINRWLPFRYNKYKGCSAAMLFFLLAADNIFLSQKTGTENISIIIMMLLISLYSFFLQKGKVYEKLLEIILPAITLFPANGIVLYAVSFMSGEDASALRSSGGELRLLVLFFSKFAFFIICEMLIKLKRNEASSLLGIQWILQISCFLISFYIANIIWNISKQESVDDYEILAAFLLIALLNILLFILLNHMENSRRLRKQYDLAQMNLKMQRQSVMDAQKIYQETKILRHDMKHHLMTAASLISDESPEEAKMYLETVLKEKLPPASAGIQTGVLVVDSVINIKFSACREKGICVKAVLNTEFKEIEEMDMGILLSNLLDNAINGCRNADDPHIELEISRKKAYIGIIVKNSIPKSVLSDNPGLNTTKNEKSMHGYGIASIRQISHKYNGTVNFREDGGMFIVEIWLDAYRERA